MKSLNVFICYRQEDSKWFVGRLLDSINTDPEVNISNAFLDVEGIDFGGGLKESIYKAINTCHIFIVVMGNSFLIHKENKVEVASKYVQKEIKYAIKQGKCILPVLFDNSEVPNNKDLPQEITKLYNIKAFTFRYENWEADFIEFVKVVKDLYLQNFAKTIIEETEFLQIDKQRARLKDNRDENEYRVLKIEANWWMVDNFSFIVNQSNYYKSNEDFMKQYGSFYHWEAVWSSIPKNWRLPTVEEWKCLIRFMKKSKGKKKFTKKKDAKLLMFGGMRDEDGGFSGIDEFGEYWCIAQRGINTGNVQDYPCFVRINKNYELVEFKEERITQKLRSVILLKENS